MTTQAQIESYYVLINHFGVAYYPIYLARVNINWKITPRRKLEQNVKDLIVYQSVYAAL